MLTRGGIQIIKVSWGKRLTIVRQHCAWMSAAANRRCMVQKTLHESDSLGLKLVQRVQRFLLLDL